MTGTPLLPAPQMTSSLCAGGVAPAPAKPQEPGRLPRPSWGGRGISPRGAGAWRSPGHTAWTPGGMETQPPPRGGLSAFSSCALLPSRPRALRGSFTTGPPAPGSPGLVPFLPPPCGLPPAEWTWSWEGMRSWGEHVLTRRGSVFRTHTSGLRRATPPPRPPLPLLHARRAPSLPTPGSSVPPPPSHRERRGPHGGASLSRPGQRGGGWAPAGGLGSFQNRQILPGLGGG